MSGNVGDVVAQLLAARKRLADAAVIASRAKADADQAVAHYREAAQGSGRSRLHTAIEDARVAGDKSDRVARILNEICEHIAEYVNLMAPGSAPTSPSSIEVSGERLVSEAEGRGDRADRFLRGFVKKADSVEENLQKADKGIQAVEKLFKAYRGSPGSSSTATAPSEPVPVDRPSVEHPVTAVVISTGAIAIGIQRLWKRFSERRERNDRGD